MQYAFIRVMAVMQREEHLTKDGLDTMMSNRVSIRSIRKSRSALVLGHIGNIHIDAGIVQQRQPAPIDPDVSPT